MGEVDDRLDNGAGFYIGIHGRHEGAVDLDPVEREILNIAHGRIAGPEIIQRNLDAERFQIKQDAGGELGVVDDCGFRDLQLKALWIKSGLFECGANMVDQVRIEQLAGRQIYGHRLLARPLAGCRTCSEDRPTSDIIDQHALLCQGNELIRADQADIRPIPADQRFPADNGTRGCADFRLEVQHEFVILYRLMERAFEIALFDLAFVQNGIIEPYTTASVSLGGVKRAVCKGEDAGRAGRALWDDCDADTAAAVQRSLAHGQWFGNGGQYVVCNPGNLFGCGSAAHQNGKFIPPETGHHVLVRQLVGNTAAHRLEERVSSAMAVLIVDFLELVQINDHDGQVLAMLSVFTDRRFKRHIEGNPVG